ncbi:MAG: ATP-binding cassette domain-containing protein [Oscillospiraceae bacterium]|jgi:ABC-type sugar transport system ATPase subunit
MGMDKYVLQTNSLSKSFGRTEILHGIDMSIEYGEIYGLIGQNGAGKTTLLRLISGLMKPTKGTVNLQTGKPFIGYMPQSCRFDDNTTVSEIIRFFARLRNADTKESVFLGKKLKLDMSKIEYIWVQNAPFCTLENLGCIVSFVESLANQKALKQKERVEVNISFVLLSAFPYFTLFSRIC